MQRKRPTKQNEDGAITELQYRCPYTNMLINTGILTDPATLKKTWKKPVKVQCRHCGRYHRFAVRDAFIEHVLALRGAA